MSAVLWVDPLELTDADSGLFILAEDAAKFASHVLWTLSGRQFTGLQEITETHRVSQLNKAACAVPRLTNTAGALTCDCVQLGRVHLLLRGRPVVAVVRVALDDVVVDNVDVWIENNAVVSLPNVPPFKKIEITYVYGVPLPAAGRFAALQLAKELFKASSGQECELPDRVTSVTREGMSFTLIDNQDFLDELRTGIYQVDLFLRTVNPDRARKRPRVFLATAAGSRAINPGSSRDPLVLRTVLIT